MPSNGNTEPERSDSRNNILSRRNVLGAVGGASAAGIAGCLGDGGDGDSGDGTETTDDGGTEESEAPAFRFPLTGHEDLTRGEVSKLNSRQDHNLWGWFSALTFAPNPVYGTEGIWTPEMERLELDTDGHTFELEIKDGVSWHRGTEIVDDFTSADMLLDWEITHHPALLGQEADFVNEVVAPDEKTFRLELEEGGYNAQQFLLRPPVDENFGGYTYRDGELADLFESLQDASSDDEEQSIAGDMTSYQVLTDGESLLSGPWMIEEAHPQQLDLQRVPGHPLTEDPQYGNNWHEATISPPPSTDAAQMEAMEADDFDMISASPPSDMGPDDLADHVSMPINQFNQARSLFFNYTTGIPDFLVVEEGDVAPIRLAKFRQAFAYAVDFTQGFANYKGQMLEDMMFPIQPTHVGSRALIEQHYPDMIDQLPDYGLEARPDMAEQRLEEAGLERDGDTWLSWNGEEFTLDFPVWESDDGLANTFQQNLTDVGLPTELRFMEVTDHIDRLRQGAIPFTISYSRTGTDAPEAEAAKELNTMHENWAWYTNNPPGQYEIPEVGDLEGDASEVVDADEATGTILASPMPDHEEIGKKIMWANAYHLPKLALFTSLNTNQLNTTHFDVPGEMGPYQVTRDHPSELSITPPQVYGWRRGLPGHTYPEG